MAADDAAYFADLELLSAIHNLVVEFKTELRSGLIEEHWQQDKEVLIDFDLDSFFLTMHQRDQQSVLQILKQVGSVLELLNLGDGKRQVDEGSLRDETDNASMV